jgi:hypothetical protein
MKKIVLFSAVMIIVTGILMLYSFVSEKNRLKPFTTTTYYYATGTCYQRIAPGIIDETDCRKTSLDANTFKNINNWTTTRNASFADAAFIAALTFNEEATADGGLDGQLTLQEALDALWNYYVTQCPNDLPSDHQTILKETAFITVYRKAAVY